MKYEKTGPFKSTDDLDQWITQAMTEAEDTEAEEFLSPDADDVEISEDLDRRILGLIEKPSAKEIFLEKYYPRILSTAALVTFVSICFIWIVMMSALVKTPSDGTEQPTDIQTQGAYSPLNSYISRQPMSDAESTNTGHPGKQTVATDPHSSVETTNRGGNSVIEPAPVSPSDEKKVFCIYKQTNADGIFIQISIAGYQSESLGKEFYVKSNEYFTVDVTVKNTSSRTFYRTVYTDCSESSVPHSHEDGLDLSYKENELCPSVIGFSCGQTVSREALKPGESYTYQLKYAPGTEVTSGFDLPGDGTDYAAGVKLYDEVFYTFFDNGSCTFEGYFKFKYDTRINSGSVSFWIPLSLEVVYVA